MSGILPKKDSGQARMTSILPSYYPVDYKDFAAVFPIAFVASHSFFILNRNELLTTDTELKAMAAEAIMGFRSGPPKGWSAPAATGIPTTL